MSVELFDKKFMYLEWDDVLEGKEVFIADTLLELREYVNNDYDRFRCIVERNEDNYPFITNNEVCYAFAYYDPNYSCKLAYAQGKTIQCKSSRIPDDKWEDCVCGPEWADHCEYRVKPEEPALRVYKCSDDTLHISNSCIIDFLFEGTEEECKQYIKEHYCSMCVHQSCDMAVGTQFCKGFKKPKRKRRMTNRELAKWIAQGNGQVKHRDGNALNTFNTYDVRYDNKPCPDYYVIRGWDETEWSEPLIEE